MQFRQSSSAHHSTVSEGLEHHREEANSPGDDSDTITNCIKVFRSKYGSVVTNKLFQSFITTLIVANAILLGIGTFDFVTDNPDNEHAFFKADQAFLIIFTVEILLQFIYLDVALFRDPWLVFDLIIIIVSWVYEGLTVLRALRTLRLVIRIKNVRNLVVSILSALPQLGAIIFLLLLIMYIFSVMFTILFKDLELSDEYFSRLDKSLLTLFEMMTMEWSDVARECMETYIWAGPLIIVFVILSGFIVFNLIVAVVCDAVAIIEQTEDDEDDDDADDAQSTQISALQKQVTGMMRSQKEIQKLMNHFARELYASKGLDLPLSLVGQEEDETDAHFDDREYSIPIDSNKQGSQIWKGISVLFRSPDAEILGDVGKGTSRAPSIILLLRTLS